MVRRHAGIFTDQSFVGGFSRLRPITKVVAAFLKNLEWASHCFDRSNQNGNVGNYVWKGQNNAMLIQNFAKTTATNFVVVCEPLLHMRNKDWERIETRHFVCEYWWELSVSYPLADLIDSFLHCFLLATLPYLALFSLFVSACSLFAFVCISSSLLSLLSFNHCIPEPHFVSHRNFRITSLITLRPCSSTRISSFSSEPIKSCLPTHHPCCQLCFLSCCYLCVCSSERDKKRKQTLVNFLYKKIQGQRRHW